VVSDPTSGFGGHRNARSKTVEEVADGFVAPPQYWEIAQPGNTVLAGPRGSGKTTLLKMLQGPALERWDDPLNDRARGLVTYSGILIPADRSWAGQVNSYGDQIEDPDLRKDFGKACFTLHVLRALSACAQQRVSEPPDGARPHDRVSLDPGGQERIVRDVWRTWALTEPVGSFAGLQEALSTLLANFGNLARRSRRHPQAVDELSAHPALDLDLVDITVPFIERFNNAVGQEEHVWAFLIDEVEFLPQGVHVEFRRTMRGRDPRIIQKISLAPYTLVSEELRGTALDGWEGHDVEVVDLTFPEKEDGYEFSRDLIEKEIEERGFTATELLGGPGFFEMPPGRDAYENGSRNATAIKELAEKDESFSAWLAKHKIDPQNPAAVEGDDRAQTLRKAMPIILLRNEYLHLVRGRLGPRTRKSPRTYVGELTTYAICENNPRRLQTFASRLLSRASGDSISDADRFNVLTQVVDEYKLHLRALEVDEGAPDDLLPSQLVETIGKHFQDGVLGEKFDPEPALSFEVMTKAIEGTVLRQILSQLIHYGAVVLITPSRFRLAHTFAPKYTLPVRKGRGHSLKTILPDRLPDEEQMIVGEETSE